MSDILDALRKAELQREHARGPGLSTQQHYAVAPSAHQARWLWGAAAAFVLGVSSAWLLAAYAGRGSPVATMPRSDVVPDNGTIARPHLRPPGPRPTPAPTPAPDAAADAAAIAPPIPEPAAIAEPISESALVTVETAVTAPPEPVAEPATMPVSAMAKVPVETVLPPRQEIAMIPDPFTPSPPPPRMAQQRSVRPAPPPMPVQAAEEPPQDPVPLLRTLPYRFQSMVPKLVINAQAYANAIEERFVIINMKKYGEGEQTVEGVRVEAIREQDIVLDYQGQQFRLQR